MKIIQLLLLQKKLDKLEGIIAKKGNYGSIKFFWNDGKGDWDAGADFGMRQIIIHTDRESHHTFLEAVDELLKKAKQK